MECWKSKSWKEADERDDHEFLEIEKEIYLDLFPHMVEEMKSEEEATEETKEGEKVESIDVDDDSSTEEEDSSEGSGEESNKSDDDDDIISFSGVRMMEVIQIKRKPLLDSSIEHWALAPALSLSLWL